MKRLLIPDATIVFILFVLLTGCVKDKDSEPTEVTGSAYFYLGEDCGGPVTISLDGTSRTINSYLISGTPSCGGTAGVTFKTLDPGTYTYQGTNTSGKSWSGSVTI